MFYFILAILLVLFYIFAAPTAIKGTIHLMLAGFALVLVIALIVLAIMRVTQSPIELWVSLLMITLGLWALWDIGGMTKKGEVSRLKRRKDFLSRFF